MKNNGTKIALLAAVLALWGYIGYLVYGYVKPTPPTNRVTNNGAPKPLAIEEESLSLDYADPFLKKQASKPPKTSTLPQNTVKAVSEKTSITWPKTLYMGYIKGSNTLIMLNYNGSTKIVSLGHKLDSFSILRATEESVTLGCNGVQKTFYK
jgi:hypothetical protein